MTALLEARPGDFVRAGAVLAQVGDVLGQTAAACRRSAAVSWRGLPTQPYLESLDRLSGDLGKVQRAYDEACDALLAYSRVLEVSRELAVEAQLLDTEAGDLSRGRDIAMGLSAVSEALRWRAQALRADAVERERLAGMRLAAVLQDLAAGAPHNDRWSRAGRSADAFATAAWAPVVGTAQLAGDLVLSVPLVGDARSRADARRRVWEAAKSAGQPWLVVEDLLAQWRAGEYAGLAGAAFPTLVLGRAGARGKNADLFGTHDVMHPEVLRALGRHDRDATAAEIEDYLANRAQRALLEDLERFAGLPAPSLQELLDGGVDLIQQEALGGHTLLRHIGRDIAFLQKRQNSEVGVDGVVRARSAFVDVAEGQRVIAEALEDCVDSVLAWDPLLQHITIKVPLRAPAGRLIDVHGVVASANFAVVTLKRTSNGSARIHTAFLD